MWDFPKWGLPSWFPTKASTEEPGEAAYVRIRVATAISQVSQSHYRAKGKKKDNV